MHDGEGIWKKCRTECLQGDRREDRKGAGGKTRKTIQIACWKGRSSGKNMSIQITSTKLRKQASSIVTKYKNKTVELQEKIGQYRKSLGERRLDTTPKINLLKF
jgi:hypothetical protein